MLKKVFKKLFEESEGSKPGETKTPKQLTELLGKEPGDDRLTADLEEASRKAKEDVKKDQYIKDEIEKVVLVCRIPFDKKIETAENKFELVASQVNDLIQHGNPYAVPESELGKLKKNEMDIYLALPKATQGILAADLVIKPHQVKELHVSIKDRTTIYRNANFKEDLPQVYDFESSVLKMRR